MRSLARAYVAVSIVGAVTSVRRGRACRLAGLHWYGTPLQHALTIGTASSAPPLMLGALLVAAERDRPEAVRLLAMVFALGVAAEPDTWTTMHRPAADPLTTACVALEVALPVAMIGSIRGDDGRRRER